MIRRVIVGVKRAIRPLIPDGIMARYRRAQHSRVVRSHVDLYVHDPSTARKWLRSTPDTYRVVSTVPIPHAYPENLVMLGDAPDDLVPYLGLEGSDVACRALLAAPRMVDRRVAEPKMDARSCVLTEATLAGLAPRDRTPQAILESALTAGLRVGIVPDGDLSPSPDRLLGAPTDVLIFAAVPLHDVGGGSRAAQIAFELVRRSYRVEYVFSYPSSESTDLGLRYLHPLLVERHVASWLPPSTANASDTRVAIVEAPLDEFLAPIETLAAQGWTIVYDIIDDWTDSSLGGDWYSSDTEKSFVDIADAVAASAPDLVKHAGALGSRAVLVPNGVSSGIFAGARSTLSDTAPEDLPDGPLLGYHGSLYGDWFDWDALTAVAREFRSHSVVVIGDPASRPAGLPDNVHFLGLKPQQSLPRYLARLDVGLVPFAVSDVTHAVSPLKVFEYLACGVPVAAPPLRALLGIDGVFVDDDLVAATRTALDAGGPDPREALATHSWGARLATLFESIGRDLRPVRGPDICIVQRPTVRFPKGDRWIRG